MKTIIKKTFNKLISDRYFFVLIFSSFILAIILSIVIAFSVHPSELQLVSHYSAYGITHLYRDQWYYLISFIFFGPIISFLHAIIAIKISFVRGRPLAILFTWLGMGVVVIGFITILAVLNVWTPLQ